MELIIQNEGLTFDVKDKDDAVKAIIEEYDRFDLCIGELLESLELKGFSIQDTVDIFAKVMFIVEKDEIYVKQDGEIIKRWNW